MRLLLVEDDDLLGDAVKAGLTQFGYVVDWLKDGESARAAIKSETQIDTELSTTGGTSDGRFIAKICKEVVEFGPLNATSHKIDECVIVNDVVPLKNIYRKTLEQLIA